MTSLLDIIGASIIGGMLLLLVLTVTDYGTREFFNYNADAIVQANLAHMAHLAEYDLRKMGFGINEGQQSTILQIANSDHLKFLSQLNFDVDTVPDTIEYEIVQDEIIDYGDTTLTMYKVLRSVTIVQHSIESMNIGKIGNQNVFRYLNQVGEPVEITQETKMVELTLVTFEPRIILSPEFVTTKLDSIDRADLRKQELRRLLRPSFWRQTRLVSKNLRR
ncbi:hypothetical protein GF337_09225 [candidate division KSB1 bacterium]|nr:hypothetical protein [candidate division KSB1 bacterium]